MGKAREELESHLLHDHDARVVDVTAMRETHTYADLEELHDQDHANEDDPVGLYSPAQLAEMRAAGIDTSDFEDDGPDPDRGVWLFDDESAGKDDPPLEETT